MGKGSARRPRQVPLDKFEENFDRIFGKKKKQKEALDELTRQTEEAGGYEELKKEEKE